MVTLVHFDMGGLGVNICQNARLIIQWEFIILNYSVNGVISWTSVTMDLCPVWWNSNNFFWTRKPYCQHGCVLIRAVQFRQWMTQNSSRPNRSQLSIFVLARWNLSCPLSKLDGRDGRMGTAPIFKLPGFNFFLPFVIIKKVNWYSHSVFLSTLPFFCFSVLKMYAKKQK